MKLRTATAASLLFLSAPLLAQPKAPPAPPKTPAAQPPTAAPAPAPAPQVPDELAAFDKDLDALFSTGGLTADGAAQRAASASPAVQRKAAEMAAALSQIDQAKLANVPQISGKLSATRLSSIPALSLMGFTIAFPSHDYAATAQIAVPLSDYVIKFPKIADLAKAGYDTAAIGKKSAEVNASQDARLAYYELVRARLQVLIAKRSLAQVQATLGQVKALAENQRLSKADLMRVESQEAQAEQTLDQLQNLADLREEQLRILIGAGPEEKLALGEDVRGDVAATETAKLDDALGAAKQKRLEFKVIDAGIKAKEAQAASDKADMYPHLAAFASTDYERPNQRYFPPDDKFHNTWAAGVQLTWTLNDALNAHAKESQIAAETNELRADRANLERGTRVEILAAQQAVALATHALETTKKGLDAAAESYRVRRELLAAERATAVDLVDTETDLTRARIAALNARVDLRVANAQLAHALGNDAK